ncbi:hypothetical protein PTKIN_Ptkin18bG0134300 [Pterospermum kingtungense]
MGGENRICVMSLLLFNLLLLPCLCSTATDYITLARPLSQGQSLTSYPSQIFELGFFRRQILPTNTWEYGPDGNLRLVDGNQDSLWSTNVSVLSNSSVAVLSDDGDLALKDMYLERIYGAA